MELISVEFSIFLLLALAGFYLLPAKWQNPFLLFCSYYFYAVFAWQFVFVLIIVTIANYLIANWMREASVNKNRILLIGILFNLAIFTFYISSQWVGLTISRIARRLAIGELNSEILVPVGFSFFVVECTSYLIDNFRVRDYPSHSLLDFALYIAYFPKRISGPIERGRLFFIQLKEHKLVDNTVIAKSAFLIIVGLFRIMVFALLLSTLIPSNAFKADFSFIQLIIWITSMGFILYNQFAGYTDFVRGVSGFFGIDLSRNFVYPMFARDFSDFWKRWHATLSAWLRDYIFLPLSRALIQRNYDPRHFVSLVIPPIITMLTSAFWHGGRPNLLIWGLLNGTFLAVEQFHNARSPKVSKGRLFIFQRVGSSFFLISLVLLSFFPFYFSLDQMKDLQYQIGAGSPHPLDLRPLYIIAAILVFDWFHHVRNNELLILSLQAPWIRSFLLFIMVCAIIVGFLIKSAPPNFIYP